MPPRLLVIGGGYIGLELGSVYAALGSQVTVVEMLPGLLPGADRDLVNVLAKKIEHISERFCSTRRSSRSPKRTPGSRSRCKPAEGAAIEEVYDKVLVSVGRKPNSAIPGLDRTQVRVNAKGFIEVDAQRRTAEPTIFAIGDVAGEPMLAHKASAEGRLAAEVIAGHKAAFEPQAIPAVVFTDPELAWCGLTETQAKEQSLDVTGGAVPVGRVRSCPHARPARRHDQARDRCRRPSACSAWESSAPGRAS